MTVTSIDWREQALCAQIGSDLFFVDDTGPYDALRQANERYPAAKRVCQACPVQAQCLEFEMRVEGSRHSTHRFGIFGGLNPRERYDLYKTNPDRWPGYKPELSEAI